MTEGTGHPPAETPETTPPPVARPGATLGLQTLAGPAAAAGLGFLMDVELRVSVELGRCKMRIQDLLRLGPGGTIKLDKLTEDPLDVRVNGQKIAHGEAVVLGEKFGVRLLELVERTELV